MCVYWGGVTYALGPANDPKTWKARYASLIILWSTDPNAGAMNAHDYLLAELCRDYLESADSPRPGLQRDRAKLAIDLLIELYPTTTVDEFGPVMLRSWQSWLCRLPPLRSGQAGSRFNVRTVAYHVDCIRRIWRWGVSTERVPEDRANALATIPRPRPGEARPPKIVEPASPDSVRAILPHLLPPVRAMVVLQLATGARPGELCDMRAGGVYRTGKLHIAGAGLQDLDELQVWAYVPKSHKLAWRGKPRYLVFAGGSKAVLAPFLDRGSEEYCFSPSEGMKVFRESQRKEASDRRGDKEGGSRKTATARPKKVFGAKYSPGSYRNAIRRACLRAGVPIFPPYAIRHLAAAEVKSLFDLDAVQALLGHHTRTMSEHYGGAAFKKAAEVAKKRVGNRHQ